MDRQKRDIVSNVHAFMKYERELGFQAPLKKSGKRETAAEVPRTVLSCVG
jgi:hypothetical protein